MITSYNGAFTPNADSVNISPHLCAFALLTFHVNSALPFDNKRQCFATSSNRRSFHLLPAGFNCTWRTWISWVITVFYLWTAEKRRRRQRPWVHQILQGREQFGDYHHLLQELCLDDGRFQRYFRLSRTQLKDLSRVGRRIGLRDTNYRRYIPAAKRLSICLR
ncbi:hypothetical protein AMECASPLE_031283 [Ameca splendens]|uniref:Uncharacterized protein n=1 Tax=Ameca splendens TaxID=208324 RepID=A0ABV0XJA3_9TELE